MRLRTALIALAAFCAVTGALAKDSDDAQAPAGQPSKPVSDLLFILSADMALFTADNTLVLTNASSTAQFYGKGADAGVIITPDFANSTAGAKYVSSSGQWLNNPTATLYGFDQNGTDHSILVTLSSPMTDVDSKMVTFNATVISNSTAIKSSKGVANAAEKQAETDNTLMLTSVQAGTMVTDVALFVDSDSDALAPEAKTERWGRGGGYRRYGGYRRGYGGYGCGWGCRLFGR